MKGAGMLVVSLRGVNFGFWSHLGCFGKNTIITVKASFRGAREEMYVFLFVCVIKWPLLGVKKSLPRLVSFRGLVQNFRRASRPFYMRSPWKTGQQLKGRGHELGRKGTGTNCSKCR